ncbi:MAG: preprotein translocase subunit SecA [Methylococcales bacterium]|nr:preprotein translocase subunit SecA [Methylococcales bacterium]
MAAHSNFKPGIVEGLYPERSVLKKAYLDQKLAKIEGFFTRLFKYNHRSLSFIVQLVNQYSDELELLQDHALDERIEHLKSNLILHGLEDLLIIEAFALIKEVAGRKLGMRHYDVQLIGGWILIKGMIAEMETGEGKTLVATLAACTAAISGIPVHVITVNDYLVKRDATLMEPVYKAFGLSVGIISEDMDLATRQIAYACDITYCSNKQVTFDYLKDKLVLGRKGSNFHLQLEKLYAKKAAKQAQLHLRGLCFAIVDEADSVFIDESRTPLILSRETNSLDELYVYQQALEIAGQLKEASDFIIDQRNQHIQLTGSGINRIKQMVESLSGIWSAERRSRELIVQALSALYLFLKDVNYLVKDGKVLIIDEFTGRVMADRSWERGLHQLIETKEGCEMSRQKETLCRISYQSFFQRYLHLAGMTGTGKEVARELFSVYRQPVIKVPTNKQGKRKQFCARYFTTASQKWTAIVERIVEIHQQGRPILIGSRSVEASEHLGQLLTKKRLPHQLLNARQDADEAEIIKMAGSLGAITVATNMAGRGTDIILAPSVNEIGGLHVIVSECHESRRIDRQLFGRCGRQGNEGSYEMFLSFDDEIVTKYTPLIAYELAKKMCGYGYQKIAAAVFYLAQTRAEKYHAAIRRDLLKMDENLQNLLAFSGKPE